MVGIAVISHGKMCEGILDSVSMVAGEMKQTDSVSLKAGESPEHFKDRLKEVVDRLDTGDGVVVFADLMGGTPFNTICTLSQEQNVTIVTGMNMAMLLTASLERTEKTSMETLVEKAMEAGTQGIRSLKRK